ncbi:amino acid ABC transporter permease [Rhizobium sp. P38BS-XIX]|uniref:amino acid ABC transporter permease n=1 Tax=Rhizobium sp. P38BS-XIX TaxID=2726740 RepID=UPI0014563AD2|nr:amino acid ABC transporter permease [Rhizobium sp. P38BS-XIX]NLS01624.1 amino acid ABC transporter permease [Rhizobium sp. P38BS-XIX]
MRYFGSNDVIFLIQAAQWTLYLSVLTFILGGLVGFVIALARVSSSSILRAVSGAYVQVFQNTPLLMQLFLIYYGLSLVGFALSPIVAAAIALTFFASAFLGEIWRGSIEAVPRTQFEAAEALALTPWQLYRYVILPQAIRISTPPTVGFFVQIVKNTSLTSIVGMTELMRAAGMMNNATMAPMKVFTVVCLIYFVICFPLSMLSRKLEVRLHAGR